MNSEAVTWAALTTIIVSIVVTIGVSVVTNQHSRDSSIIKLVEAGASPLEAMCSIKAPYAHACAVLAAGKIK